MRSFAGDAFRGALMLILAGSILIFIGIPASASETEEVVAEKSNAECQAAAETDKGSEAKLKIILRAAWEARDPVLEMKKHKIGRITVHHTGVRQRPDLSVEQKLRNLQAFSQREDTLASGRTKAAWADVPYHYYICVDGRVAEGRCIKYAGDSNTPYDTTGHAQVVLEGSFGTEQPNEKQIESLVRLLAWLADKYSVPVDRIKGHGDYAATACPGTNLIAMLPEIRTKAVEMMQSTKSSEMDDAPMDCDQKSHSVD